MLVIVVSSPLWATWADEECGDSHQPTVWETIKAITACVVLLPITVPMAATTAIDNLRIGRGKR